MGRRTEIMWYLGVSEGVRNQVVYADTYIFGY